ncbi:MAG: hypothetical protein ACTHN2_19775 [Nitrobacter sp.]
MNAGWLASRGVVGETTLAFGRMLPVIGQIYLGIKAIEAVFNLMAYATELAKQKIEEFNRVASAAASTDQTTDFYQRFTKSGEAVKSLDAVTEALQRFKDASHDKLGGSDLQQRVGQLSEAGNFKGNTGVAQLGQSTTTEDKLRATISLIDQALQKGERLAALDIAGKAFGPQVADALKKDSGYLDDMIKRADAMSKAKIISPEDVGRAIELKDRMDAAQKVLADKWKPLQDDLAKLGMNYHESWVDITETIAKAVGYATDLYLALKQVPDWFGKFIGNASIWSAITAATTTAEGRAAAEASLGISSDPKEIGAVAANAKLGAQLRNPAAVRQAMQAATDIAYGVQKDTSKNPADQKTQTDVNDAVDRAINALRRHAEQTEADAKAVGLGAGALARFRAEAQETSAVQANGGKETAEQAAQFKVLQDKAEAAAVALAKARIANDISRGQQTALLSPEDVAIANQLRDLYPDVATALGSVEAQALRTNQALSQVSSQVSNDLTTGLTDIASGAKTASQGFSDMAKSILRDIEQVIIKLYIVGPLMRTLGIGGGLFGGLTSAGGIAGAVGATSVGGLPLVPAFASGTDNAPGGWSIVGEKGPELVNLSRGAQVIPNDVLRSTIGGAVSVSMPISIDARGADQAAVTRLMASMDNLQRNLPRQISSVVKRQQTRGVVG